MSEHGDYRGAAEAWLGYQPTDAELRTFRGLTKPDWEQLADRYEAAHAAWARVQVTPRAAGRAAAVAAEDRALAEVRDWFISRGFRPPPHLRPGDG